MARPRKDYKPISVRLDAEVFEKLEEHCRISGQSKTVAIERAILQYTEKQMEILRRSESGKS